MDTQYMEILERLKTRHLLTSSALLEKAQELLEKSDPIMSLSKIALPTVGTYPNFRKH